VISQRRPKMEKNRRNLQGERRRRVIDIIVDSIKKEKKK